MDVRTKVVVSLLLIVLAALLAVISRGAVGFFAVAEEGGSRPASPMAVVVSYAYFVALILSPPTLLGLWFWLHRRNRK